MLLGYLMFFFGLLQGNPHGYENGLIGFSQ
jgi:hypothetical protein